MAKRNTNGRIQQADTTMKRRGILAAAGAVVASIVARYAAQPVAAFNGDGDGGALLIGANDIYGALPRSKNTATIPTQLTNTSGTVTASPTSFFHQGAGLIVTASDGAEGIMGFANGPFGIGVWGVSNRGRAVYGELTGSGAADGGKAVSGDALGNTNAYGVYGTASSASSIGVYGQGSQGIGVHGESTTGIGVDGLSVSGNGVQGHSTSAIGVVGTSTDSHGIYGASTNHVGAIGISTNDYGVVGYSPSYAGVFHGNVYVSGNQIVAGGKFAAVKASDGSHRLLHAVEAPEAWFEDIGSAQLVEGKASVRLDPAFAGVVVARDYQVFVTPEGDCNGLYVAGKSAGGFEVRELKAGTSSLAFGYRVIAKRKDLADRPRLERVSLPEPLKLPAVPRVDPAQRRGTPAV